MSLLATLKAKSQPGKQKCLSRACSLFLAVGITFACRVVNITNGRGWHPIHICATLPPVITHRYQRNVFALVIASVKNVVLVSCELRKVMHAN